MAKLLQCNNDYCMSCRHCSEDSSVPSILLLQVQVPSTPSMLFSIYTVQIWIVMRKEQKGLAHFLTMIIVGHTRWASPWPYDPLAASLLFCMPQFQGKCFWRFSFQSWNIILWFTEAIFNVPKKLFLCVSYGHW